MKRCAFVTGAGRNTGLGIARKLAAEGRDVVITGRDAARIADVAASIAAEFGVECFAVSLNQVDTSTVGPAFAAVAERGYVVDTLVCNAANPGIGQPILGTPVQEWADVIETNAIGSFAVAQAAAAAMVEAGIGGSITFVASNQARRGVPARSAYSASKGAISAMTKVFAVELAEHGIRTNCLMPGRIYTDVFENLPPEALAGAIAPVPSGRLVTIDEVAAAVAYLASDDAASVNGCDFVIDGGCDAQMFSS